MDLSIIAQTAASPRFREHLVGLLVKTCEIDTSPRADLASIRGAEAGVFDLLEKEAADCGLPGLRARRQAIDPGIERHPFYSQLYYTQTPERPAGLAAAECYAGRVNLLLEADGDGARAGGVDQAINAHVDVVKPYFPPRVEGGTVFGRGACDDKGNVVAVMGALRLVGAFLRQHKLRLNRSLTVMLVIEEETGGNGSLSLAIDRELKKRYESLTVMEICENRIFPGNRGCVWYKIEAALEGANLFEASAYIVEELEKEGRSIRAESDHPLFPHRPVQTCHGIIGNNGQHPSRINAKVGFKVIFEPPGDAQKAWTVVRDVIASALRVYTGVYGDKTQVLDPKTGKPKVDHHFDLEPLAGAAAGKGSGFLVTVYGSSGHMGSIFENDGAITKMATMVRALIRSRQTLVRLAGGKVNFRLDGWDKPSELLMEGGQGFLPTHEMGEVQRRLRRAVVHGAESFLRDNGHNVSMRDVFEVSFNKLHNAAFAGDPDSPDMRHAIAAAKAARMWKDEPIRGWDVSCDARIFACEYPGLPVLTTGPGSLNYAHGDQEQIDVGQMVQCAEFLAYFILRQTGTAGGE